MAQVYEISEGIYRISTYFPQKHLSFNQFLILDESPTLIHTGDYPQYLDIRQAIAEILSPLPLTEDFLAGSCLIESFDYRIPG